ncbi:hypothetical protein BST96_09215 [Oceanicoccus sagamiensis]|uniref:JmjC domain-containing protein n=2 Tax=Oceanicoccus sagamiensis TaxID=716816 RepID=A0A1X9NEG7_9GAMM|nr:hypothetical protein BST96_09215 [Oceanicoccus sagamiensis]
MSLTPKVMKLPKEFNKIKDPVQWALHTFQLNIKHSTLQITHPSSDKENNSEGEISHINSDHPGAFTTFANGVNYGNPVHGRLELINIIAGQGKAKDGAQLVYKPLQKGLVPVLEKLHPLGYFVRASLWLSSGNHRYSAHCDAGDGLLFHLSGRKTVRVWPTPKALQQSALFDFSNLEERMAEDYIDFNLKPGQVLFIPSGAAHEVWAKGEDPAVSVSFHSGSTYPILHLCDSLNQSKDKDIFSLPEKFQGTRKKTTTFFEPSRFIPKGYEAPEDIPQSLQDMLKETLIAKDINEQELDAALNQWWQETMANKSYPGDFIT